MKAIRSMTKEERKAMDSEIRRRCVEICAMREKLKADGIDVEAIRNDLMKEAGIE